MARRVHIAPRFDRDLKRLKRKYPSVVPEVNNLIQQLRSVDVLPGDKVAGVGYDVYKVRLRNTSARIGKSGGFRVIYYVRVASSVVMLTIYSKTDQSVVSPSDIRVIIHDL